MKISDTDNAAITKEPLLSSSPSRFIVSYRRPVGDGDTELDARDDRPDPGEMRPV
jgi:hypothetical protein